MHVFSLRIFQEVYLEAGNSGFAWKEGCGMKDRDGKTSFMLYTLLYC